MEARAGSRQETEIIGSQQVSKCEEIAEPQRKRSQSDREKVLSKRERDLCGEGDYGQALQPHLLADVARGLQPVLERERRREKEREREREREREKERERKRERERARERERGGKTRRERK